MQTFASIQILIPKGYRKPSLTVKEVAEIVAQAQAQSQGPGYFPEGVQRNEAHLDPLLVVDGYNLMFEMWYQGHLCPPPDALSGLEWRGPPLSTQSSGSGGSARDQGLAPPSPEEYTLAREQLVELLDSYATLTGLLIEVVFDARAGPTTGNETLPAGKRLRVTFCGDTSADEYITNRIAAALASGDYYYVQLSTSDQLLGEVAGYSVWRMRSPDLMDRMARVFQEFEARVEKHNTETAMTSVGSKGAWLAEGDPELQALTQARKLGLTLEEFNEEIALQEDDRREREWRKMAKERKVRMALMRQVEKHPGMLESASPEFRAEFEEYRKSIGTVQQ